VGILFGMFIFLVQVLVLFMFCLTAGFVLALGKSGTGIKLDFFFFALVCGVVLLIL